LSQYLIDVRTYAWFSLRVQKLIQPFTPEDNSGVAHLEIITVS